MDRPSRFGYEDITAKEMALWEAKYGETWADTVEPERYTTIWNFETLDEMKAWVATSDEPAGYFDRAFERTDIHREFPSWEWEEKEIEL